MSFFFHAAPDKLPISATNLHSSKLPAYFGKKGPKHHILLSTHTEGNENTVFDFLSSYAQNFLIIFRLRFLWCFQICFFSIVNSVKISFSRFKGLDNFLIDQFLTKFQHYHHYNIVSLLHVGHK